VEGSAADEWVVIGRLGALHGVRGMLRVHSETEPPEQIFAYFPWRLRQGGRQLQVDGCDWKVSGKRFIASLPGIADMEAASFWVGALVEVPGSAFTELPKGEYYWHQLLGLDVYNLNNEMLGKVKSMLETGANDVLLVAPCEGSLDNRERLIPWTPGVHLVDVSLEKGSLRVDWDPAY